MPEPTHSKSKGTSKASRTRRVSIDHIVSVDFKTLAATVKDRPQWLVPPAIPAGRSTAFVAKAGHGKSLFLLDIVASLATGRAILGRPAGPPMSVVYLDMEMIEDELAERLTDMGYDFTNDSTLQRNLHYYLLQDLDPLDTRKGGAQILEVAERDKAEVVVLDTLARVVGGDENEADTFRAFATHTGAPLKVAGITVVRLDHMGKDVGKGSRGSSAKRDDVDVNWLMSAAKRDPSRISFKLDKGRQGWIPQRFDVDRIDGPPLRHELRQTKLTEKQSQLKTELDELDVPIKAGRPTARKALKTAGIPASSNDLAAVIAARRGTGQVSDMNSSSTTGQRSRTGTNDDA